MVTAPIVYAVVGWRQCVPTENVPFLKNIRFTATFAGSTGAIRVSKTVLIAIRVKRIIVRNAHCLFHANHAKRMGKITLHAPLACNEKNGVTNTAFTDVTPLFDKHLLTMYLHDDRLEARVV